MLINKSKEAVVAKYSGIEITVYPGNELDVRDFGVDPKTIKDVERHIIRKASAGGESPFTQEDRATDSTSVKEFGDKIAALEAENKSLAEALARATVDIDKLQEQFRSKNAEIQGQGEKIKSLEAENNNLKAQVEASSRPDTKSNKK